MKNQLTHRERSALAEAIRTADVGRQASMDGAQPDAPKTHLHHDRERDFGIGYGNSSGYGTDLHYTDGHVDPVFRII